MLGYAAMNCTVLGRTALTNTALSRITSSPVAVCWVTLRRVLGYDALGYMVVSDIEPSDGLGYIALGYPVPTLHWVVLC